MVERLVGRWRSRGRTVDGVEVAGTDVYEWFDGGQFLVHHVDVVLGSAAVRVLEMIGPFDGRDAWPMRAFDNGGGYGEMTLRPSADGGLVLEGGETRSFLSFGGGPPTAGAAGSGAAPTGGGPPDVSAAGSGGAATMTARWERLVDGRWEHWMDMEFTRDGAA